MLSRLSFAALLLVPMLAGPVLIQQEGCTDEDPVGLPETLEHEVVFQTGNPILQPIPEDAAVDPLSALYIERMVQVRQASGMLMVLNEYAAPVYYADETTPRYDLPLVLYGTSSYCGKRFLLDVPIPDWAEADPGSDKHMVVVDRGDGCVYDFWGYNNNSGVPKPNAWWASGIDAGGDGIYHTTVGAGSAANFSFLNGAVWPDEIAAGEIPHALVFAYDYRVVKQGQPVPPAEHNDGSSTEPYALPEGTRIQLDPALDLDTLGLEPHEEVIARALQVYGMFLVDASGGPIALHAISGQSAKTNPWDGLVPDPEAGAVFLPKIPVERFRVLELPEPHPGVQGCEDTRCGVYE